MTTIAYSSYPHHQHATPSSSSSSSLQFRPTNMAPITSLRRSTTCVAGPSDHYSHTQHLRSRSREIFTSFRDLVTNPGKGFSTTEVTRDSIEIEPDHGEYYEPYQATATDIPDAISITLPPSLPSCSLSAAFMDSETNIPVPPAFYPGQTIPTVLTFELNRYSSLPHSLNPALSMSLIGTLLLPQGPPRTIICVSVSLAEGLELWSRDAQQAYAYRPSRECHVDPKHCLPGGTYSLPLTVQVPSTPRLPPSFKVADATFAVTYALSVSLTCDDPIRPGFRVNLAECSTAFDMYPETMPTRTPRYTETSFSVRTSTCRRSQPSPRWTIEPCLPTTTYSPTSQIPLRLILAPPKEITERYHVLVRIALIRREHSSKSDNALRDPSGQAGLVKETEITSSLAWFEVNKEAIHIDTVIPIMMDGNWQHGYSTMLNVGSANSGPENDSISVSSTFHLASTLAFLPIVPRGKQLKDLVPIPLPPRGVFKPPRSGPTIDMAILKQHFPGTVRTLPLPIVLGSVSEPRSALHTTRWSDLHLDQSSGTEVGRVITGEVLSCEDGWIQAPPSYLEALEVVPYDYL